MTSTVPDPVTTPDELEEFLAAAFPKVPRAYRVSEVTGGGVVLRLPIGEEHERPGGTVSGPVSEVHLLSDPTDTLVAQATVTYAIPAELGDAPWRS